MVYITFSVRSICNPKILEKNKRLKKFLTNKSLFLFCSILFSRSDSSFSFFVFFFNFFFQAICCIVMLIGITDFTV